MRHAVSPRITVEGLAKRYGDVEALRAVTVRRRRRHRGRPAHLAQALDFVARHRQRHPLGELVDQRFSLAEVDAAFRHAAARRLVRPAVVP